MIDKNQILFLKKLLYDCRGIINAESYLIKSDDGVYGIEFDNYQTLKLTLEPVFDMPEDEVDSLMNLFAHGLPILSELLDECQRLEYLRQGLLEAIRTILIAAGDDAQRIKGVIIESEEDEEENNLTVGEK